MGTRVAAGNFINYGRNAALAGAVLLAILCWSRALAAEPAPAQAPAQPGESFKDCEHCPEMVVVPAGKFMMGSPADEEGRFEGEEPLHEVTIRKPFAAGKFTVTFDEWAACASGGGCAGNPSPDDRGWGRGRRPVIEVSWNHAQEYVQWLSRETGKPYRLLSEAEWEYAARAGTQTPYIWGRGLEKNRANCDDCGTQWSGRQTAPVGQFPPNAFGLYDMAGNVWQWTEDCWSPDYSGGPFDERPKATPGCFFHIVRGGSWVGGDPGSVRAAVRNRDFHGMQNSNEGFRVARTLVP
jgi:formylglycine-generating enzyme required for sulfatase activity